MKGVVGRGRWFSRVVWSGHSIQFGNTGNRAKLGRVLVGFEQHVQVREVGNCRIPVPGIPVPVVLEDVGSCLRGGCIGLVVQSLGKAVEVPFLTTDRQIVGCFVHRDDNKVLMKVAKEALSRRGEGRLRGRYPRTVETLITEAEDIGSPGLEIRAYLVGIKIGGDFAQVADELS